VKPGTRWILIVVGLLVGNVAMMGVLIAASSSSRPAIIPAYYDRAVAYNGELADADASRKLGWQATATIEQGRLSVHASDASGAAVRDARVHVIGVPRAQATARFERQLTGTAGLYVVDHRGATGVHDLEVHIERGTDHFVARLVVEAR
jgi:nitrogen fixation protein FixH